MAAADTEARTRKPAAGGSDELADEIKAIRDDLQSLSETMSRIARGQMGKAQSAAKQQLGHAQDVANQKMGQAEDAIRRNPLSAVAIAVGLGFLFGLMTRR